MAPLSIRPLALAAALAVSAGSSAHAQQHGGGHQGRHGHGQQQGAPQQTMGDMERMRGLMSQMQGMMDRMRSASPADRERMMNEMRPMMQQMMPMMQGMMGHGHGGAQAGGGHQGHVQAAPGAAASASTKAYEEANAKMHRDMAISFSGDPDVDFVRGMIPHHQGAIDMAQAALRYGKDEWVRTLAQEVIAAQTREIGEMRDWLARNPR